MTQETANNEQEIINDLNAQQIKESIGTPPDFSHTGHIMYTMDFHGPNARIKFHNTLDFYDRVAMYQATNQDVDELLEAFKKNKKGVMKHFAQIDRQRITGARFILDKFIGRLLGAIYTLRNKSVTSEDRNFQDKTDKELSKNPATPEESFKVQEKLGGDTVKHQEGEL